MNATVKFFSGLLHAAPGERTGRGLLAAAALVCIAAALRCSGIRWGLPLAKAHIDESVVIFYAMRFLSGDLNPHIFFDYPTLMLYLLAGLFLLVFAGGYAVQAYASLDQFVGLFLQHDAAVVYTAARCLSAVFGVASVYLVYRIAREDSGDGWWPALIFALLPLHVLHSHYATVDVASIFFLLLAFVFLNRYALRQTDRSLYGGAFLLGLAAAVKYYPALFILPVLALIVVRHGITAWRPAGCALLLMAAGFFAGCPYALLDFPAFSSRFLDRFALIIWQSPAAAPVQASVPRSIAVSLVPQVLSWPVCLALAAGIIYGLCDRLLRRRVLFWASFPVLFLAFLSTWRIVAAHYLLPAAPFLIIAGVPGINAALRAAPRAVYPALMVALCLPLAWQSARIDALLLREDTRLIAGRWIREQLPPGARILRFPNTPEFTGHDPYRVRVDWEWAMTGVPASELAQSYEYVITSGDARIPAWEQNLAASFVVVRQWPHVPLASFHHPRITLYGKKNQDRRCHAGIQCRENPETNR